jgi:hypothetical protein
VDVSCKTKAETLPPQRPVDYAIVLEPSYSLRYGQIYNILEFELKMLNVYIETNVANGFIKRSSTPAAAPILIPKEKDGVLRLCLNIGH